MFWSLLVNQETDLFRSVFLGFCWHFSDACRPTVGRWPLHFQPSGRGFEQEEEGRAATTGKQSPVQKPCPVDFGPCSAVASGSCGCPAARMAGNPGFHRPDFLGEVEDSSGVTSICHLRPPYENIVPSESHGVVLVKEFATK